MKSSESNHAMQPTEKPAADRGRRWRCPVCLPSAALTVSGSGYLEDNRVVMAVETVGYRLRPDPRDAEPGVTCGYGGQRPAA